MAVLAVRADKGARTIFGSTPEIPSEARVYVTLNVPSIMCTGCTSSISSCITQHGGTEAYANTDLDDLSENVKQVSFKCAQATLPVIIAAIKKIRGIEIDETSIKVDRISADEEEYDLPDFYKKPKEQNSAKIYFLKAFFAGLFGIPLLILELLNVIPHPMGLVTQLLNAAIGIVMLIVMVVTAWDSIKRAWAAFRAKTANMETLVVLGLGVTWVFSMLLCIAPQIFPMGFAHAHFSSIAIMLMVTNIGMGLNKWAIKKAGQSVGSPYDFLKTHQAFHALKLIKKEAGYEEQLLEFTDIRKGDYLLVRPGENIPADGQLLGRWKEGDIEQDEDIQISELVSTGEALPIAKRSGQVLLSGMQNCDAHPIVIQAKNRATRSHVCNRYQILKEKKNTDQSLTTKVSRYFAPVLIGLSVVALCVWIAIDPIAGWANGISAMVNVLMCACPCALALAAPLSQAIATMRAKKEQIFVRDGTVFEKFPRVKHAVFDKNGTLATLQLKEHTLLPEELALLAALEAKLAEDQSEMQKNAHPITEAVLAKAIFDTYQDLRVDDFKNERIGLSGFINKKMVRAGNRAYFENLRVRLPAAAHQLSPHDSEIFLQVINEEGITETLKPLYFKQSLRPEAADVIREFKNRGTEVYILTGDSRASTEAIAAELGIPASHYWTAMKPEDKAGFIQSLKANGDIVLMVGDGSNDEDALAAADIGVALGRHAKCGNVVFPEHLTAFEKLRAITEPTLNNIRNNLWFTMIFNALSIVIAAGVLFPLMGVMMHPAVMCTAMLLSTLFVLANAAWLAYKFKNDKDHTLRVQAAIAAQLSLLQKAKNKLMHLNQLEKVLITGFVLFGALTVVGVVYTSMLGMGLSHLIGMMTVPMALAGCAGCATLLSGLVGLGIVLLVTAIYVGYLIYQERQRVLANNQENLNTGIVMPSWSASESSSGASSPSHSPATPHLDDSIIEAPCDTSKTTASGKNQAAWMYQWFCCLIPKKASTCCATNERAYRANFEP